MEIIRGLSALDQAISIVKILRDVKPDSDLNSYKAKLAELHGCLAEVELVLTDARKAIGREERT